MPAPARTPARITARRLVIPSFISTAETWWSAVLGEMNSRSEISALVRPRATSLATSSCRLVSPAGLARVLARGRGGRLPTPVLAQGAAEPVGDRDGARAGRAARRRRSAGSRSLLSASHIASSTTARARRHHAAASRWRPSRASRYGSATSAGSTVGVDAEPAQPHGELTDGPSADAARPRRPAAAAGVADHPLVRLPVSPHRARPARRARQPAQRLVEPARRAPRRPRGGRRAPSRGAARTRPLTRCGQNVANGMPAAEQHVVRVLEGGVPPALEEAQPRPDRRSASGGRSGCRARR